LVTPDLIDPGDLATNHGWLVQDLDGTGSDLDKSSRFFNFQLDVSHLLSSLFWLLLWLPSNISKSDFFFSLLRKMMYLAVHLFLSPFILMASTIFFSVSS
jgi:hypothetical protein